MYFSPILYLGFGGSPFFPIVKANLPNVMYFCGNYVTTVAKGGC
jgi:hypothetical protein